MGQECTSQHIAFSHIAVRMDRFNQTTADVEALSSEVLQQRNPLKAQRHLSQQPTIMMVCMYVYVYGFYIYLHTQTTYLACKLNSTDLEGGCRLSDVSPRRRRHWKEPLQEETPHGVMNCWCVHAKGDARVCSSFTASCVAALSAEQNTAARLELW